MGACCPGEADNIFNLLYYKQQIVKNKNKKAIFKVEEMCMFKLYIIHG